MKDVAVYTGNCGLLGFVIPKGIAEQVSDEVRVIASKLKFENEGELTC